MVDPDGTFKLDIDPRGGWFAPTWVTLVPPREPASGGRERGKSDARQRQASGSSRTFRGNRVLDPYDVLEVSVKARQSVIDKAYRAIIFEEHPDRGGDGERARQVNAAYDILGNAVVRREFDAENGIS